MYKINKDHYAEPGVAQGYAKRTSLFKGEEVIISYLYQEMRDKFILDIGVGPGRTTPYLSALSQHYVGIDYSENMLRPCQARYPEAHLLLCDAKHLCFKDKGFDVVYFCWNAIDDADHEDRLRMLHEIHRVLRNNGIFFFSAHNLESKLRSAYRFRGFVFSPNPVKLVKENVIRVASYGLGILNHLKMRKHERHERHYSILNDRSHNYRLLTYYISRKKQVRQLEQAGFCQIEMVRMDGSFVDLSEPCEDDWIYYLARR